MESDLRVTADSELRNNIEQCLLNYYRQRKKADFLSRRIELLETQVIEIGASMNAIFNDYLAGVVENLAREEAYKIEQIAIDKESIRNIELGNSLTRDIISSLSVKDQKFLELIHGKDLTLKEVGSRMSTAQSTAGRNRDRILDNLAGWSEFSTPASH